jgi:hypothetical protein
METLESMHKKFDAEEYRDTIRIFEGFSRLTEGRRLASDAERKLEDMRKLAEQAEVISRFQSEPISIDGVIIDRKSTSYAIINGQILAEGDDVDSAGKIVVKKIREDHIEFEYQDVVISKQIRGK